MIEEVIFLEGCPHCMDGIPAVVTFMKFEHSEATDFVGDDWTNELIEACLEYPMMRIMACKKIGEEE